MIRGAVFSEDRLYRYHLHREWGPGPSITWVMLNPSTADETVEDPTIRRCIGFSKAWGYGRLSIVNLFALRSPYPKAIEAALANGVDIVGPENNTHILTAAIKAQRVVCAWGAHKLADERARFVLEMLTNACLRRRMVALGATRAGAPKHPLYVPAATAPAPWPQTAVAA